MTGINGIQHRPSMAIRSAALLYAANGAGFGVGAALTGWYFSRHGELPMTPFGFRSLSGPFESLGPDRFMALTWALVGLCALDLLTGTWLWRERRRGAVLGLATTPAAVALGAGFALPFLLAGIPIRLALLGTGRRSLR